MSPVINLRHCSVTVEVETSTEQKQVGFDLDDLLALQKPIPKLRKCKKFWDCVADRNKGKTKHCFWPRELGPEPKEDPCLEAKYDEVARGQMSCPPRKLTLPDAYLGRWCHRNDGMYSPVNTEEEWMTCSGSSQLEIKHHGFEGHLEGSCKFISVKYTGEKMPMSTKPRKEDWVPVVRITTRCAGEGTTWKGQVTFKYIKGGGLLLESK